MLLCTCTRNIVKIRWKFWEPFRFEKGLTDGRRPARHRISSADFVRSRAKIFWMASLVLSLLVQCGFYSKFRTFSCNTLVIGSYNRHFKSVIWDAYCGLWSWALLVRLLSVKATEYLPGYFNTGSANGLVPWGSKIFPEPTVTHIYIYMLYDGVNRSKWIKANVFILRSPHHKHRKCSWSIIVGKDTLH